MTEINKKVCTSCNKDLPLEIFSKNKSTKDGLQSVCKECQKQYYQENRERIKARNRKRDEGRREEKSIEFKIYYEENKEDFKERYDKNKERILDYTKEWRQNNPDKLKEYTDKRKHKAHKITKKEWESCKKYFNYSCAYCGISEIEAKEKYNNYLHKEHVVHNGLGDISNCVPSCKICNSSKGSSSLEEWYTRNNKRIRFSNKRLLKINKWLNGDYLKYTKR